MPSIVHGASRPKTTSGRVGVAVQPVQDADTDPGRGRDLPERRAAVVVGEDGRRALAGEGAAAGAVLRHPDAVTVAAPEERDGRTEDDRSRGRRGRRRRSRRGRRARDGRGASARRSWSGTASGRRRALPAGLRRGRRRRPRGRRPAAPGRIGARGERRVGGAVWSGAAWVPRSVGPEDGARPVDADHDPTGPWSRYPEGPWTATLGAWSCAASSVTARAGRRPAWRRSSTGCGREA